MADDDDPFPNLLGSDLSFTLDSAVETLPSFKLALAFFRPELNSLSRTQELFIRRVWRFRREQHRHLLGNGRSVAIGKNSIDPPPDLEDPHPRFELCDMSFSLSKERLPFLKTWQLVVSPFHPDFNENLLAEAIEVFYLRRELHFSRQRTACSAREDSSAPRETTVPATPPEKISTPTPRSKEETLDHRLDSVGQLLPPPPLMPPSPPLPPKETPPPLPPSPPPHGNTSTLTSAPPLPRDATPTSSNPANQIARCIPPPSQQTTGDPTPISQPPQKRRQSFDDQPPRPPTSYNSIPSPIIPSPSIPSAAGFRPQSATAPTSRLPATAPPPPPRDIDLVPLYIVKQLFVLDVKNVCFYMSEHEFLEFLNFAPVGIMFLRAPEKQPTRAVVLYLNSQDAEHAAGLLNGKQFGDKVLQAVALSEKLRANQLLWTHMNYQLYEAWRMGNIFQVPGFDETVSKQSQHKVKLLPNNLQIFITNLPNGVSRDQAWRYFSMLPGIIGFQIQKHKDTMAARLAFESPVLRDKGFNLLKGAISAPSQNEAMRSFVLLKPGGKTGRWWTFKEFTASFQHQIALSWAGMISDVTASLV
ncbi:hypothetical protein T439DRAFT_201325 [Meredithblackwellia eburnea MCA 4105]